jgi:hypothetical protein
MSRKRKGARKMTTAKDPIGFTTYKRCEHDGTPVFKLPGGRTLGAGSGSGKYMKAQPDLLIDCAASRYSYTPPGNLFSGTPFEALSKHFMSYKHRIGLDWSDGGKPPFALPFWRDLVACTPEGAHIVCACYGGHGRTGTAMAAILIAHGSDPTEAIKGVRQHHCSEAIETRVQVEYLYGLVGKEPPEEMIAEYITKASSMAGEWWGSKSAYYSGNYTPCPTCDAHYKGKGPCDGHHNWLSEEERIKNPPIKSYSK